MPKYELNQNGVINQLQDLSWLGRYIELHSKGRFSVRELFSSLWPKLKRPRYYGRWFKKMVELGSLQGIRISRLRPNNSWEYEIL